MILKFLSRVCLLFLLYVIISYSYIALTTNPTEGDSLNYHIPLAKSYLNGTIFQPHLILDGADFLKYSPGASQGILSLFYLLQIPPGFFNVVGVVLFFASLYYLGRKFDFESEYSIIFATSITTLNGIVRWMNSQIIDIYLASFFVLSLALLQKPEKSVSYFLRLGIVMGMLIGSKYSGLFFGLILILVYGIRILKNLSAKTTLVFLIPVICLGLFWYLRNFILMGNPLYPQGFLIFKDEGFGILNQQVWRILTSTAHGFYGTINAAISEYMIWVLAIPIVIFFTIKKAIDKDYGNVPILLIGVVGILNFCVYLNLPSDKYDHIMVSVVRYSYPAFIPMVLGVFLLAKKFEWVEKISIVAIANLFFVSFPNVYNPKLLFIYIPLSLYLFRNTFTTSEHKDRKEVKK